MGTKEVPQQGILLPLPPELEEFKAASCWASYGGRAQIEDTESKRVEVKTEEPKIVSSEQVFAFRSDYNPNFVTPQVGRTEAARPPRQRK